MKKNITVIDSWFHNPDHVLYEGRSEKQAIKIARRHPCAKWDATCKCGGPRIFKTEDNQEFELFQWEAQKPFTYQDSNPVWVEKY